eukprot:CAMPEP_0194141610 /NCGR_PEP_ID=MMETSP0152-20130528/11014_1 /TAXON_ID=1049557 /ORGANISM="Thalassiothrix antarctica, Strain L6-D1" /LENGTH=305 /DNA_ID=CAMNT_0038840297 /DNA_START=73 /DNA_END=990 /DNA_ORIENTATION=-
MTSTVTSCKAGDSAVVKDPDDETQEHTEDQQAVIFDKTTEKGAEDGLFRACMKAIRSAHKSANRLRAALVLSGLFTDKKIYREVIALFYVATNTMEKKMIALKEEDEICYKMLSLGYRFGPQYEKDLQTLYGGDWKVAVEKIVAKSTDGARSYIKTIESMTTGAELAGAAFCLWGALIIGGGAAAKPRVQSLCGKDACNLFETVTGPGRGERKAKFIEIFDSLAIQIENGNNEDVDGQKKSEKEPLSSPFEKIITISKECMQGNNELIVSVKRNPWWLKYVLSSAVGIMATTLFYFSGKSARGGR